MFSEIFIDIPWSNSYPYENAESGEQRDAKIDEFIKTISKVL